MSSPVTMADVARAAGVHQTTVSLALRNHPSLPMATRQRIRQMAETMGYRRNPLVSALMSNRRKGGSGKGARLGFLTADVWHRQWQVESPNYARLYDLMAARADSLGYGLEEFWINEPGLTPGRLRQILLHRGIRGLILCPLPGKLHEVDFDFSDFAVVALRYTLRKPALDHVSIDYCAAMNLTIERLLQSGHRRIVFATTREFSERVNHLSLGAYLAQKKLASRNLLPPVIAPQWNRGLFIQQVLRQKPDALIAPGHRMYCHFAQWLQEEGIKPPGDLSLVTLDGHMNTDEAGVVQNLEGEAAATIELVTSRVERGQFGLPQRPQVTLLEGNWRNGPFFHQRNAQPPA